MNKRIKKKKFKELDDISYRTFGTHLNLDVTDKDLYDMMISILEMEASISKANSKLYNIDVSSFKKYEDQSNNLNKNPFDIFEEMTNHNSNKKPVKWLSAEQVAILQKDIEQFRISTKGESDNE